MDNPQKEWTIMVYMSGDNNLSTEMAYALQDIREVAERSNGKINLLVYYDSSTPDVPTTYFDLSDFHAPFRVPSVEVPKKLYSPGNVRSANENSALARSVINFVDWSVNKVEHFTDGKRQKGRKAHNYALIFSGHSFGFQNIGFFKDESSGYHMTMPKLAWVFDRITGRKKGEPTVIGKKLGILGFDSCVMGMLEVGYQFHKYAETIVASEGTIPSAGWTYSRLLGNLLEGGSTQSSSNVARDMVADFVSRQSKFTLGGVAVDMSAWESDKIPDVVEALGLLSGSLLKCINGKDSVTSRQIKRILLNVRWNSQSYMFDQSIDLKDFCQLLYSEVATLENDVEGIDRDAIATIKEHCSVVIGSIDDCVIATGFCGGNNQYSNGISLFFPLTKEGYDVSTKGYSRLDLFSKENKMLGGRNWNKLLKVFLYEVSRRPNRAAWVKSDEYLGSEIHQHHRKMMVFRNDRTPTFYGQADIKAALSIPAFKLPQNEKDRLPQNEKDRLPQNEKDRLPRNEKDRLPQNEKDRLPQNEKDRLPQNEKDRLPQNEKDRLPQNEKDRLPQNEKDRLPWDPSIRLSGGSSGFFGAFVQYRNVDRPWSISGVSARSQDGGENESRDAVLIAKAGKKVKGSSES